MIIEIDKKKKEIFDKFGFIDDQSQSMDDLIIDLTNQRDNIKKCCDDDYKTINKKMKLKYIIQRKGEKSQEFFCSAQNIFAKLYDTVMKAKESALNDKQIIRKFDFGRLDDIKTKFLTRLANLKQNLKKLSDEEDRITSHINSNNNALTKISDNIYDVFKNDKYFDHSVKKSN